MEENKINSNQISPKKTKNNNKEIVEIHLGKPNPAFNLVSIKARYRFHLIKENFSKMDYNTYLRKCKNMYSISSKMSAEMNMSDIYHEEKKNIGGIIDIFGKIDDKISSKRIRLTKFKKNYSKMKLLKRKSKSVFNILKENTNEPDLRITNNNLKNYRNNNKSLTQNLYSNKDKNEMISFNNIKKMSASYSTNFKKDFVKQFNNNKINLANHNLKNIKLNPTKTKSSFFEERDIKRVFSREGDNIKIIMNKRAKNTANNTPKKINELEGLYNFKSKQKPKSGTSAGMTITNFGAIIYNNSIFRSRGISNFVYNNQSLPFIYESKYNISLF